VSRPAKIPALALFEEDGDFESKKRGLGNFLRNSLATHGDGLVRGT